MTTFPLRAVVYYTVVETGTHWFVQYLPYHPVDYKRIGGHQHDTESILVVVAKAGGPLGRAELMETRFHTVWYQYARTGAPVAARADDIDGTLRFDEGGHPEVYAQRKGHGLCGGWSGVLDVLDLELGCNHAIEPHLDRRGVVYKFAGRAEVPDPSLTRQVVGYDLVEMTSTIWAHARDKEVFVDAHDFHGDRCGEAGWQCPRGFGTALAGPGEPCAAPWAHWSGRGVQAVGEQFFDPAYVMSKRLAWEAPFSTTYTYNPFVGVDVRALAAGPKARKK